LELAKSAWCAGAVNPIQVRSAGESAWLAE
jgi:hypothetical protein